MFQHRLTRELAYALAVKLLVLAAIYALFFGPSHRIDPAAHIAATLFSPAPR